MKQTLFLLIALIVLAGCSAQTPQLYQASQTYNLHGENIQLLTITRVNNSNNHLIYDYAFTSDELNYGSSSTIQGNQTQYTRNLKITQIDGQVTNILVDNVFDDLEDSFLRVHYYKIPMQCEINAWDEWVEETGYRFHLGPSLDNVIRTYFARVYDVDVRVTLSDLGTINCFGCLVCAGNQRIDVSVDIIHKDLLDYYNFTQI